MRTRTIVKIDYRTAIRMVIEHGVRIKDMHTCLSYSDGSTVKKYVLHTGAVLERRQDCKHGPVEYRISGYSMDAVMDLFAPWMNADQLEDYFKHSLPQLFA